MRQPDLFIEFELDARGTTGRVQVKGAAHLDGFELRGAEAEVAIRNHEALPITLEGATVTGWLRESLDARGTAERHIVWLWSSEPLGDPADDCEVQATAAGLAFSGRVSVVAAGFVYLVEAVEQVRQVLGRDAEAVVLDAHPGTRLAAVKQAVPACTLALQEGRSPRWRQDVYMDISRIKADTGYEPKYTVETGVQDYVAWLWAGNVR